MAKLKNTLPPSIIALARIRSLKLSKLAIILLLALMIFVTLSSNATADSRIDNAIQWAEARIGCYPKSDNSANLGWYHGKCHAFVRHAFSAGGINTDNYSGSAILVYNNYKTIVDNNRNTQHVPPRGTMVLYRIGTSTPHTALSLGGGQVIHTNTGWDACKKELNPNIVSIMRDNYTLSYVPGINYLGWIDVRGSDPTPDPFNAWSSKSEYLTTENVVISWDTYPGTSTSPGYALRIENTSTGQVVHNENHGTNTSVNVGKLPAGNYSFYAVAWKNWTERLATSPTRTFTVKPSTGALRVTIEPSDVRSAGAQWRLTSGPDTGWKNSGSTISNLPVGSYTITYKEITGWDKPANASVSVSSNQTTSRTGTYNLKNYTLYVRSTNPTSGVTITSSTGHGGTTGDNEYQISVAHGTSVNLTAPQYVGSGNSRKSFQKWDGTHPSSNRTVSGIMDGNKLFRAIYVDDPEPTGSVRVTIEPSEVRSAGGQWRLTSGPDMGWKNSGSTISNLPVGSYTINFKKIDNFKEPDDVQLEIEKNKTATHTGYYSSLPDIKFIADLEVGDRVVDNSWQWEFRTGSNYSKGEDDLTRPVNWIVVDKDHYGAGSGVTLLSEELIGLHAFDNSTDRGHSFSGCNHWGNSGTTNATFGLRPWLNSTGIHDGEGFYYAFSDNFKNRIVNILLPNKDIYGNTYNTSDKVFIPSTTELGDISHGYTYKIGNVYSYFVGADNKDRVMHLVEDKKYYWTRSPVENWGRDLRHVDIRGYFSSVYYANNHTIAVRPALNLLSETTVSIIPNEEGAYEILKEQDLIRYFGQCRLNTAVAISRQSFKNDNSADAVVLARADKFADALSGGVLAYKENAPLLITSSDELQEGVQAEIERVLKDDGTIYILGGPVAISEAVKDNLNDLGDYTVKRIAGRTRMETACKIAREIGADSGQAIIAYSHDFPDALAISSHAARAGIPILTSRTDRLSDEAKEYLEENNIEQAYVVGGTAVISDNVLSEIELIVGSGNVTRLGGTNRYETAKIIADQFFPTSSTAALAYGRNFPDALAGGVNAAMHAAPVLLVEDDRVPPEIAGYLTDKKDSLDSIIIYGGTAVVQDSVVFEVLGLIQ